MRTLSEMTVEYLKESLRSPFSSQLKLSLERGKGLYPAVRALIWQVCQV